MSPMPGQPVGHVLNVAAVVTLHVVITHMRSQRPSFDLIPSLRRCLTPWPHTQILGSGQGISVSTNCGIGISKLRDKYITMVGSMCIIIIHVHVQ